MTVSACSEICNPKSLQVISGPFQSLPPSPLPWAGGPTASSGKQPLPAIQQPPRAFHRLLPGQAGAKSPSGLQKAWAALHGGEEWPALVQKLRGRSVQAPEPPWETRLGGSPCLNPTPFPSGSPGEKLGEEVPGGHFELLEERQD